MRGPRIVRSGRLGTECGDASAGGGWRALENPSDFPSRITLRGSVPGPGKCARRSIPLPTFPSLARRPAAIFAMPILHAARFERMNDVPDSRVAFPSQLGGRRQNFPKRARKKAC